MTREDRSRSEGTILPVRVLARRFVAWAALVLSIWSATLYATGGFRFTFFSVLVTSRDPVRPLASAALLFAAGYLVFGRRQMDDELDRMAGICRMLATPAAIVASLAVVVVGLRWGTFAASGVDAYGYVSQASLWTHGSLRVEQPFVAKVPWPAADWAFAPIGYRPALDGHAIVPSYPPGLPLLMAIGERLAGECGPYYVVPVLGGLCVWSCYLIGRRAASAAVGACAAVLLACSPAFLLQLLAPMSDVPAAALWSAALCQGLRRGAAASASAGALAAIAILIRPNLAPLALVVAAFVAWPARGTAGQHSGLKHAAWFAAALVPAAGAIAILNWRLYGSPLISGYGDIESAYATAHIAANARRYGNWLVMTQTPLIGLAAIGLLAPGLTRSSILERRASLLFLVFTLVIAASYLPFAVFDDWWFLRFFLPAFPLLLVSMTASILWCLAYVPVAARVLTFVALGAFLVVHELRFAIDAGLMRVQRDERRYVAVARFIESATPPNAVFLSLQHAGSVRHYAGRLTVRFDRIATDLDAALVSLERAGWRPYILLEDWEEPQFTRQFGSSSEAGRLAWRPYARLSEPGGANIYDPRQISDAPAHELVAIPPPGACDCRHR
jgi:hypothetical protein